MLSTAFSLYPFLNVVSDILSVISLCLLHTLPLSAILSSICAICSNIPELGSWKDCKPWNGICFSYYKQVSFYAGPMSEKGCGNQNSANQTQNSHLKLYFCGVRGLTLILYIVQLFLIFVLFFILFILCPSVYCLCVYVHCTTATGWLPNCS
jgi:hypothetical protein